MSIRKDGDIKPGDALRMVFTEDGWRLSKLDELGPVARQVFEEIEREGGTSLQELIEREGIDVEKALRDVTFE